MCLFRLQKSRFSGTDAELGLGLTCSADVRAEGYALGG